MIGHNLDPAKFVSIVYFIALRQFTLYIYSPIITTIRSQEHEYSYTPATIYSLVYTVQWRI